MNRKCIFFLLVVFLSCSHKKSDKNNISPFIDEKKCPSESIEDAKSNRDVSVDTNNSKGQTKPTKDMNSSISEPSSKEPEPREDEEVSRFRRLKENPINKSAKYIIKGIGNEKLLSAIKSMDERIDLNETLGHQVLSKMHVIWTNVIKKTICVIVTASPGSKWVNFQFHVDLHLRLGEDSKYRTAGSSLRTFDARLFGVSDLDMPAMVYLFGYIFPRAAFKSEYGEFDLSSSVIFRFYKTPTTWCQIAINGVSTSRGRYWIDGLNGVALAYRRLSFAQEITIFDTSIGGPLTIPREIHNYASFIPPSPDPIAGEKDLAYQLFLHYFDLVSPKSSEPRKEDQERSFQGFKMERVISGGPFKIVEKIDGMVISSIGIWKSPTRLGEGPVAFSCDPGEQVEVTHWMINPDDIKIFRIKRGAIHGWVQGIYLLDKDGNSMR
ncbi:MAG: hypothetical protein ACYTHM_09865 [Planctomycetota bacterium]|jgi:hypothetical protein